MPKGDHIYVSHQFYTHHGIDIGDGTVVALSRQAGRVARISREEFGGGNRIYVRPYDTCDAKETTIRRALESVGREEYDVFFNNCEHFATWCKTGRRESHQVDTVVRGAQRAVFKGTIKSGVVVARTASRVGVKGLMRSAVPLMLLADLAQTGVEYFAPHFGVDPKTAQNIGRGVGLGLTATVGVAVAGPVGMAAAAAVWAGGELAAEAVGKTLNQLSNSEETSELRAATA